MKQFKHKKFIGLALLVFLVFMVLGKYTQSTAFTSSSRVYATTVVDKKTGNKVRFEVRKVKGDKYEVKNTETGDTYQANAQAGEDRSLSFKLAGNDGNSDGTIRITPSMVPGGDAKVEMTDSDTYTQVEGGSEVIQSSEASSTSSSSEVKSIIKDILESSSSSSGSDASSSTSSNDTNKPDADIKTKTDVNGDKETTYVADYSTEDIKSITEAFGKWLYQSDYAKDAVLVQSSFDSITKVNEGSPTFLSFKAPKEEGSSQNITILANLINADGYENISGVPSGIVNGKEASNYDFKDYKNRVDSFALGINENSGKTADYSPTSSFRLYTLKDKKHAMYEDNDAEQKALFKDFSADDKTGGNYNGYNKLYKDLVDQDKDSYQIVLGSNGTVYYVTNYWIGNYDKKAVQTYKVAPDDMQEAYQELLKHYSSAGKSESSESSSSSQSSTTSSTSSTSTSSSSSEAKTESKTDAKTEQTGMDVTAIKDNNFQSLEGTWKNGNGSTLTFSKNQVTSPTDYEVQNANSSLENGYLRASLRTGMYGAIIFFIPKGTTLPNVSGNYPDASDNTKDRILVTQSGGTQSDAKQFYYKAD
ncbi:DUF6287 domain-containing protein [uncultured Streptococcus sp.]|uniref:DUF6287 domain-containing protein n=1 Tax=uncultured Streptococcus sp. TaxID=83427 RepID=UPI0025EE2193|nr:DUF6287 domain-containing protein [uncultured Streptococcus sp.]